MQALAWNTWGPLSDSAGRVYGWTNDDIALLSNWGPIAFLLSTAFFAWLLDVRGNLWDSTAGIYKVLYSFAIDIYYVTYNYDWSKFFKCYFFKVLGIIELRKMVEHTHL